MNEQLKFIRNGGLSKRYHTMETLRTQNIAEHSFGVAWLCEAFTNGTASKNLIMAALSHDLAEHIVGDIPSPTKRKIGEAFELYENNLLAINNLLYALSPREKFVLKLADLFDGILFCLQELELGNSTIRPVFNRFVEYAWEHCDGEEIYLEEKILATKLLGEIDERSK